MVHANSQLRESAVFASYDSIAANLLRSAIWKAAGRATKPLAADAIGQFTMAFAVRAADRGSRSARSYTAPQRQELAAMAASLGREAGLA